MLVLPVLVFTVLAWMCGKAGSNACTRKGFRFSPWALPTILGFPLFALLSLLIIYALPTAAAKDGMSFDLRLARAKRASTCGLVLSSVFVALLVGLAALAIVAFPW